MRYSRYDKMSSLLTLAKITSCQHEINHSIIYMDNPVPEPNTMPGTYLVLKKCLLIQKNKAQVRDSYNEFPSSIIYAHTNNMIQNYMINSIKIFQCTKSKRTQANSEKKQLHDYPKQMPLLHKHILHSFNILLVSALCQAQREAQEIEG